MLPPVACPTIPRAAMSAKVLVCSPSSSAKQPRPNSPDAIATRPEIAGKRQVGWALARTDSRGTPGGRRDRAELELIDDQL